MAEPLSDAFLLSWANDPMKGDMITTGRDSFKQLCAELLHLRHQEMLDKTRSPAVEMALSREVEALRRDRARLYEENTRLRGDNEALRNRLVDPLMEELNRPVYAVQRGPDGKPEEVSPPESKDGELPWGFTVNLEEVLVGDVNRLRYITRFATALVAHKENVAEHCFYVSLYSLLLGWDAIHRGGVVINMGKLLKRAILHDLEEVRTGDMYRPFKVSDPDLRTLVHKLGRDQLRGLLQSLLPGSSAALDFVHDWDVARDTSCPEGCIVAFADYLSVLAHMLQELRVANMTMKTHYDSMIEYAHEFDGPEYDFLRPYVLQAQKMVRDLLGEKTKELKEEGA